MTNEELNTKLYKAMFAEQEKFRDWLLEQSPKDILDHAYEYTTREDILLEMEYLDLSDAQANALLESKTPIADIFKAFEKTETGHMDDIRESIESRANDEIKRQREELLNMPVYPLPASQARERGELEEYRKSHRANVACKDAIEDAIRKNYKENCLDFAGVKAVLERFGVERTCYVLAATVQDKDWDGRISQSNKSWAKAFHVSDEDNAWGGKRRREYEVDKAHPGLTDMFVTQIRKEVELMKERKPSVLKKLKEAQAQTAPKAPKKHREAER